MTSVTQNFAAMVAACAIVLATWTPVLTVPVDEAAVAATSSTQISLPHVA